MNRFFLLLAVLLTLSSTGCIVPPEITDASVLAQHELSVISRVKRGKDYSLSGRHDLAEREFRIALDLRPDVDSIYNDLGFVLQSQGRLDEAESMYQTALQLSPNNVIARENLARVLYVKGEYNQALRELETILATYYQIGPLALKTILGQPFGEADLVSVHRNMATIYYATGRYDEAVCNSWIAHTRAASEYEAGQHARLLLSLDQIQPASRVLRDVVVAKSGNVSSQILVDYGIALFLMEDYSLAKTSLARVLSNNTASMTERRLARLLTLLISQKNKNKKEEELLFETIEAEDARLCEVKNLDSDGYWPVKLADELQPLVAMLCEADEN